MALCADIELVWNGWLLLRPLRQALYFMADGALGPETANATKWSRQCNDTSDIQAIGMQRNADDAAERMANKVYRFIGDGLNFFFYCERRVD